MVITGGGEPTYEFDTVLRLIRDSPCHDISLYTAGQWGETTGEAKDILDQLHMANQARESPADIELRLSVDDFHAERLGHRPAVNIIEQYGRHHHALNSIRLTIRTVLGYEAVLSDIGRELDANLLPLDRDHRVLALAAAGPEISILAMNLIASGRLKNPNRQRGLTFGDAQEVWESSDKNFGKNWPVMFDGGLNIGVRPSGKVYLYGGTPEDYGHVPERTLDAIVSDLAKDSVNQSVYQSRWREIVELVDVVEPAAIHQLGDMSDPTAVVPQLLTDPARLLYVKLALTGEPSPELDYATRPSWTESVRHAYAEHLRRRSTLQGRTR